MNNVPRGLHGYLVDLRNHGNSPSDPIMNLSVMAHDVAEFIEEMQLQNVTLLGNLPPPLYHSAFYTLLRTWLLLRP